MPLNDRHAARDEKKRKRMISNRESARRSRLKKQKLIENLINEKSQLEFSITENIRMFEAVSQRFDALEMENSSLITKKIRLEKYLASLESILENPGKFCKIVSLYNNEFSQDTVASGISMASAGWNVSSV